MIRTSSILPKGSITIDRSRWTRGVMGANSFEILNNLDSSYSVVGRKALNSLLFLIFSSPSLFNFGQHPNVFINLHLNSIHRSGLPLLKGRSSNFKHLNIMGYVIYLQRETI